jgi:cation transport ATPase
MLQGVNNVIVSVVNKNVEEIKDRLEEAIKKDLEEEESEESEESSSSKSQTEEISWKEAVEFYSLFPFVFASGFFMILGFYSMWVLYHSLSFFDNCSKTYIWWYVLCTITILYLINYSITKFLNLGEPFTQFKLFIPITALCNGLFSLWGYFVINDSCVINNTKLNKLHQISLYHTYSQLITAILCVLLFVILYI